jgi:rod shape-determining protein MreC
MNVKRAIVLIITGVALVLMFGQTDLLSQNKLAGGLFLSRMSNIIPLSIPDLSRQLDELKQENAALRVQLLSQNIFKPSTVEVYSSYPLNSKREIAIAAGSSNGVREGDAVTWGEKVLVGKVISVSKNSSIVATIFDPSWEMAVRIGANEINALFKGGNTPTVTLIPHDGIIQSGDIVITASKDFPYGLEVGKIKDIKDTAGTSFREANIETEIQLSDLRHVTIHN